MESPVVGEIQCKKVTQSRALRSYIQKSVWKWISSGASGVKQSLANARFLVTFVRTGKNQYVDCQVEVRVGTEVWKASHYAEGAQQAFTQCIEHLSRAARTPQPLNA